MHITRERKGEAMHTFARVMLTEVELRPNDKGAAIALVGHNVSGETAYRVSFTVGELKQIVAALRAERLGKRS